MLNNKQPDGIKQKEAKTEKQHNIYYIVKTAQKYKKIFKKPWVVFSLDVFLDPFFAIVITRDDIRHSRQK